MRTEPVNLSLRVLTFNCLGVPLIRSPRARLTTLAHSLNETNLDVICLQEVQLWRYLPLLTAGLGNFPHRAYEPFIYAPKGGLLTLARAPLRRSRYILYQQRGRR